MASNTATLLPISTRGAGMATVQMYEMLSTCEYFYDAVPTIYSMYRAVLGQLEVKLAHVQDDYDHLLKQEDKELQYTVEVPADFGEASICPRSIANVLNAVGFLEHETGDYMPAVHKRVYDNNRYIPRTDNILISNLRETVVALSDAKTPLEYRRNFFKNNPIPGAVFENNLLLNPDEIIPPDYALNDDHLGADMNQIFPQVDEMLTHFGNVQLRETIFEDQEGEECLLVTNNQGNLAIPSRRINEDLNTYYTRCLPFGKPLAFWSWAPLDGNDGENLVNLLGELPNISKFNASFYRARDIVRCPNPVKLNVDYNAIIRELYPRYEYSMPINLEEYNNVNSAFNRYYYGSSA